MFRYLQNKSPLPPFFKGGLFFLFLLSAPVWAQMEPVGPKGDTPPAGTSVVKPAIDLPYKPEGVPSKSEEPAAEAPPPEPKKEVVIPFIPSKSPTPVGALDPLF